MPLTIPLRWRPAPCLLALACALSAASARAEFTAGDFSLSGFGTLGWAQSDQAYTYQRFITRQGTGKRDTLLGVQADWRIAPEWYATLQLKLAPSLKSDSRWDVSPAWGFLAWRPNDDWLLRVGRLRMPLYLYSESMDVGHTHDMARLPGEMYAAVPVPDFDGFYASRSWTVGAQGDREITLDAYGGTARTTARLWLRDGLPPVLPAGALFAEVDAAQAGMALTWRTPDLLARASASRSKIDRGHGVAVTYPYVPLGPGLGYYQTNPALPGPGISTVPKVSNTLLSAGAELSLGQGWRVTAEVMRNIQHDTQIGADATAGYVAVFKQMGPVTPYVSVAALRSRQLSRDWYQRLTANPLPDMLPGATQINLAQRLAADTYWPSDQHSLGLGASYKLGPSMKLKGEWLHTRVNNVSRLVDTPSGSPTPIRRQVNVLSVNLDFTF